MQGDRAQKNLTFSRPHAILVTQLDSFGQYASVYRPEGGTVSL